VALNLSFRVSFYDIAITGLWRREVWYVGINFQEGDNVFTMKMKKLCFLGLLAPINQITMSYNSECHTIYLREAEISDHLYCIHLF
jgi:hypothetical protein